MRTHPLLAVVDQIDPEKSYTLADVAQLTGRSRSSVGHWLRGGLLGEAHTEPSAGDSPQTWRWALKGATLQKAVHAPPPAQDHSADAVRQAWRRGCRDDSGMCDCRERHNRSTRTARRRRADERFPVTAQREFLRLVELRRPVSDAAEAVGMSEAAVIRYARRDPQFEARFRKARRRLCRKRADCGKGAGWRSGCRGLWCWQQHSESTAYEPAGPRGRARANERARGLGYSDVDAYLAAHPDTPAKRLAAVLGVGHSSVRRWRADGTQPHDVESRG